MASCPPHTNRIRLRPRLQEFKRSHPSFFVFPIFKIVFLFLRFILTILSSQSIAAMALELDSGPPLPPKIQSTSASTTALWPVRALGAPVVATATQSCVCREVRLWINGTEWDDVTEDGYCGRSDSKSRRLSENMSTSRWKQVTSPFPGLDIQIVQVICHWTSWHQHVAWAILGLQQSPE